MNHPFGKTDWLAIAALLLLNPVVYWYNRSIEGVMPDAAAYITLGTQILEHGLWYLPGWGHLDSGLILPPLYPLLVGSGRWLLNDGIRAAEYISSLSIILATIPLYAYAARLTQRRVAVMAVLLVQLNFYYAYYGTLALTEATFLFILSCGLWWAHRCLTAPIPKWGATLLLGIIAGLLFLTRQMGLAFLVVIVLMWTLRGIRRQPGAIMQSGSMLLGFALLVAPYSSVLYLQTGQTLLVQHFRMGQYTVTLPPSVALPTVTAARDYEEVLSQRRELRQLLPDASEMIGYTVTSPSVATHGLTEKLLSPLNALDNLLKNGQILKEPLGKVFYVLFLVTLVTSVTVKVSEINGYVRILLPSLIVIYLLMLSVLTGGLVPRYVHILYGLAIMHSVIEIYWLFRKFVLNRLDKQKSEPVISPDKLGTEMLEPSDTAVPNQAMVHIALAGMVLVVYALSTPLFYLATPRPKVGDQDTPFSQCYHFVQPSTPVMTLHPLNAYLAGGTMRFFPDDTFPRVLQYAQRTGVRWFVLTAAPAETVERRFYTRSSEWLSSPNLEAAYPQQVKVRCQDGGGLVTMYEILEFPQ